MAVTNVQINFATNTLAQTFGATFASGPIDGNLLAAMLWHDEIGSDIADISSAGWTRMNTFLASGLTPDFRLSVFAKFAGAAESSDVDVDLGESSRRAHLWIVEWSGAGFSVLPDEDTASFVSHENTSTGTSNQVDAALAVPANNLAVTHVGMTGTITDPSVSWDGDVVFGADASANFRGSAFGWLDGADNEQPTVTWTGSRTNAQMFVLLATVEGPSAKGSPILII